MKKKLSAVMLFVLGALAMVVFQQVGQTQPALTALDYAEIDQLYARYNVTWDAALGGDGDMFARLFTEDGVSGNTDFDSAFVGYEELKTNANKTRLSPIHYTTSILIEPTTEGAMGMAYFLLVGADEEQPLNERTGQPYPKVTTKGVYHDQLVKTPEGWRFKERMITFGDFSDELLQELER